MLKLSLAAVISVILISGTASAQWLHQETGSAFEDTKLQIALVAEGRNAFGLRCSNGTDFEAVFMAPDSMDAEQASLLNALGPELLIRVDDAAPFTLSVQTEMADQNLKMVASSPVELFEQVRDGKSRVSVALRVVGELYHETAFRLNGSTKAVGAVIATCSIPQ